MTSLVVTFEQKTANVKIRKSLDEVQLDSSENLIIVSLTQEETGRFNPDRPVKVQCHIKIGSAALATDEMEVAVHENINGKVIV